MKGSAALLVAMLLAPPGCSFEGASGVDVGTNDAGVDADLSPRTVELSRGDGDAVMDTWIFVAEPAVSFGAAPTIVIDQDRNGDGPAIGFLFFDLVGDDPRQIPEGSAVTRATLSLTIGPVTAGGGEPGGDAVTLCPALRSWGEDETWVSFGGEPPVEGVDYDPAACAETMGTTGQPIGFSFDVDVTAAVTRWVAGDLENRGWLLRGGSDGVNFYASDETDSGGQPVSVKPALTIEFAPR